MSKLANYLQEHLRGEVISAASVRERYSHDRSILSLTPEMIVRPYNLSDIRKLARFTWQLAEKGHVMGMTPRGGGTDTTGAAIGKGVIISMPSHFNEILEFDTKQRLVRVQPGLNAKALQSTMMTHGFFIPVLADTPAAMTIGGAIANNYAGANAYKYGTMRDWVEQAEIVLANGEVMQTGRVNRRELEKKKGLAGLEGDIYRAVDGIISDNPETVKEIENSMSNAGYALDQVKHRDGSVDLLPLIAGSQGTLGIVSEVILKVAPYEPNSQLVVIAMPSLQQAHDALDELRKLHPSRIDMLDFNALDVVYKKQPARLVEVLGELEMLPAALYFIEFDDKHAGKNAKKIEKAFSKNGYVAIRAEDYDQRMSMWQLYNSSVALLMAADSDARIGVPVINDVAISDDKFEAYFEGLAALGRKYRSAWPVWGSAADGRFSVMPNFDLHKVSERQKALKLMDEYYTFTTELGGVVATNTGEGRLHTPAAAKQYSGELLELFAQVKQAFDPHGTLNPGVKLGVTLAQIASMTRDNYQGMLE